MRKGKQIHRFIAFLLSMTLTVPAFTSMAFAAVILGQGTDAEKVF